MKRKRIGFIGLGAMGGRMAANLLSAGFPLAVYDIRPEAIEKLVKIGATAASSPKKVAEASDIVLLSLPSSPQVEEVILGKDGVLECLKEGGIIVDLSTIDPLTAKRMFVEARKKGIRYLDAPVSGGTIGAERATLTIMVGGDEDAFNECMEIFRAIGKNIFRVGPSGMGQTIKLVNQILVGIHLVATSEAILWGIKAGADPKQLYEVIRTSAGNSWIFENKALQMIKGMFEPGFTVWLQHKDLGLALKVASELNMPMPLTSIVYQIFEAAKAMGLENKDHGAVIKILERLSGMKITEI